MVMMVVILSHDSLIVAVVLMRAIILIHRSGVSRKLWRGGAGAWDSRKQGPIFALFDQYVRLLLRLRLVVFTRSFLLLRGLPLMH